MNEPIKIIEIPNFLKIKIVKINNKHCAYYVEDYNHEYFCANENGYLKTQPKIISFWALSIKMPMIEDNINIKPLEEDIYKLHKILTKDKIPRVEKGQKYYIINRDFTVYNIEDCYHGIDNVQYNSYNYFTSESLAKEFASKLQEHLIELWKKEMEKK